MTTITTTSGNAVNPITNICPACTHVIAQDAIYWTDDSRFDSLGRYWTPGKRFEHLQRAITDTRAHCLQTCGRVEKQ